MRTIMIFCFFKFLKLLFFKFKKKKCNANFVAFVKIIQTSPKNCKPTFTQTLIRSAQNPSYQHAEINCSRKPEQKKLQLSFSQNFLRNDGQGQAAKAVA